MLGCRVNRLANALSSMGLGVATAIAVLQVNCAEHVEAYFAAAKVVDAVYVPIPVRSRADELTHMLPADSEPRSC